MSLNEVLGEAKAIDLLLALLQGPKYVRQLHREVGGSTSTIEARVNRLIQAGLIQEVKGTAPGKRVLELTNRGKAVAINLAFLKEFSVKIKLEPETFLEGPRKWILALLYVLGPIRGSTRLEKLLFLLKEQFKVVHESFYDFKPHLFGPFSATVLNDARVLQEAGLIDIEYEIFETHPFSDLVFIRRTYILTEAGKEVAKFIYEKLAAETKVKEALSELRWYNSMPLNLLLQYIYKTYPEYVREEVEV